MYDEVHWDEEEQHVMLAQQPRALDSNSIAIPRITVLQDNKTSNVPLLLSMIAHTMCREAWCKPTHGRGPRCVCHRSADLALHMAGLR